MIIYKVLATSTITVEIEEHFEAVIPNLSFCRIKVMK